ncbi:MAG TPA: hypothetical protein VF627_04325 [Abditibacterium sp.]|jgi:hypothetical protein
MNKKLMLALAIVLSIPVFVFAQSALKNQQRHKRYQLMQQTVRQMQQLTLAVHKYSFDYKGKMPPMQNPAVFKNALQHYTGQDVFISAASGKPFVPNAKLSGKPLVQSNRIVWCYDPQTILGPNSPTKKFRVVGFSNATIAMPESRWQREKETAGLP